MKKDTYKQMICRLLQEHHLLNLSEIHECIPDAHFASIYRNVEALCKDGVLKKIVISKDNVKYELASHSHGHFVCDDCEEIEEIQMPKTIMNNHTEISDMTVRGVCDNCSAKT
jgi:Fe2+ or Zn2+ uptake regulation protein